MPIKKKNTPYILYFLIQQGQMLDCLWWRGQKTISLVTTTTATAIAVIRLDVDVNVFVRHSLVLFWFGVIFFSLRICLLHASPFQLPTGLSVVQHNMYKVYFVHFGVSQIHLRQRHPCAIQSDLFFMVNPCAIHLVRVFKFFKRAHV